MEYRQLDPLPFEAVLINLLAPGIGYCLIVGIAYLVFYKISSSKLLALKIQKPYPPQQLIKKEVYYSIRTLFLFALGGVLLLIAVKYGYTRIYLDIDRFGWGYLGISIVIMIIIHDAYFYWLHRLMHHPKIFKYTHVTHHKFSNPTPWCTFAFGPIEAVLQFGIVPLLVFTIPLHWSAIAIFIISMTAINSLGHLGFEIYNKKLIATWLGKVSNTSTHHNRHHLTSKSNYGLYFIFWDRLMSTEEKTKLK